MNDTIRRGDRVSFLDEVEGQRLFGVVLAVPRAFGDYLVRTNLERRGERLVPRRLITKEVG